MSDPAVQPLFASAVRAVRKLQDLGDPLPADVVTQLSKLESSSLSEAERRSQLETLLRPYVLVDVSIDEQGIAVCAPGAAPPRLVQHGWRSFLVRVANPHRIAATLSASPGGVYGVIDYQSHSARIALHDTLTVVPRIKDAWLDAAIAAPKELSGLEVEYKVISLYSREGGVQPGGVSLFAADEHNHHSLSRSPLGFAGFRTNFELREYAASFDFDCAPARDIRLDIREPDGRSCMAAITVRDAQGRSYPSKAMRLAPDMFFHEHVYRATGEMIRLPEGRYEVSAIRGPEYRQVSARGRRRRGNRDGSDHPRPLGRSGRPRLLLGRPAHPRRWLLALQRPERRRHARNDDPACPRGRPLARQRAHLGAVLLPPETVLQR